VREQLAEATSGEEDAGFWEEKEEILAWHYDRRDLFSKNNLRTRYSAVT